MTNRLFIALKLPQEIREEIVSLCRQIDNNYHSRRWDTLDKLHLTIKFLGNVEENKTPDITSAFLETVTGVKKIKVQYERFGFFLPRILWIGLRTEKHLFELVDSVEEKFSELGFEKENRKYKPHITLLRIKENPDKAFINAFNNFKLPDREFFITEAALIKSTLKPSGSVYSDINTHYFA